MTFSQKLSQHAQLTAELEDVIRFRAIEVAALRNTPLDFNPGTVYSRPLGFDEYQREQMTEDSGDLRYGGVDYPIDYPLGTPLLDVKFGAWVGDGYESMHVTFPESYLDDPDWRYDEKALVDRVEQKKSEKAQAAANVERQRKLEQLAKLQKELGV